MTLFPQPQSDSAFARRLLAWYDRHGRRDLPWRQTSDPYAVWVAEIMLQQTQVRTVLPYYRRFLKTFPTVERLARADIDQVLHLWSGLGYYARARNLHAAAREIVTRHRGRFPREFGEVVALPGIGRSTAGAILAIAFGQRHPILDGNVKRVLARYFHVPGWPGDRTVEARLWMAADALTPARRVGDYTQAIMDLGATLCRRGQPACGGCPQHRQCAARRAGDALQFPAPRPRRHRPQRRVAMLLLCNADGDVLLARRPPAGIWGGLWSLPECDPETDIGNWCRKRLGLEVIESAKGMNLNHAFSHFDLEITPVTARVRQASALMEKHDTVWYNVDRPDRRGLAAPVKFLLQRMRTKT